MSRVISDGVTQLGTRWGIDSKANVPRPFAANDGSMSPLGRSLSVITWLLDGMGMPARQLVRHDSVVAQEGKLLERSHSRATLSNYPASKV